MSDLLRITLCRIVLLLGQAGGWAGVASADLITYQLQAGSQISFAGTEVWVPNGLGFSEFPIVAQPGSSLASSLSGSFMSEVGSTTLTAGGTLSQATSIFADILDTSNTDVGNMAISSPNLIVMGVANTGGAIPQSYLSTQAGVVSYSINSGSVVGSGSYLLNSAVFSISNIQYGMQGSLHTASFDFSASALLPTNVSNVFVNSVVSGSVLGVQAVPEPGTSSMVVAGLVVYFFRRRRRLS